jgi:hypothetical protein
LGEDEVEYEGTEDAEDAEAENEEGRLLEVLCEYRSEWGARKADDDDVGLLEVSMSL